jgi:hypothetical protein
MAVDGFHENSSISPEIGSACIYMEKAAVFLFEWIQVQNIDRTGNDSRGAFCTNSLEVFWHGYVCGGFPQFRQWEKLVTASQLFPDSPQL